MDQFLKKHPELAIADKTPEHMGFDQILPEEFPTPPDRPTAIVFEAMFLYSP